MNCPICDKKMSTKGLLTEENDKLGLYGLPESKIPYFLCETCRNNELSDFAYFRTFFQDKWYYYNWGQWNIISFNPSRRKPLEVIKPKE